MSRKTRDYIFMLLALAFILIIPLWRNFAIPKYTSIPSDFVFTSEVVSTDNFYSEDREEYSGPQYSKTDYNYRVVDNINDVLIVENKFDVKTPDNKPIFSVTRQYGINKLTGEHVPGYGDKDREGYLFAPKNLKAGDSFIYWHINYDGPAVMHYQDQSYMDGIKIFHYVTDYNGENIDQTKELDYLPGVGIDKGVSLKPHLELWVEPQTGSLIKYQDNTVASFYDLETGEIIAPWNNFSNKISDKSTIENLKEVTRLKVEYRLVNFVIPLVICIISFFCLSKVSYIKAKLSSLPGKRILTTIGGIIIFSLGLTVLFGWYTNNEDLIRLWFIGNSTMNPLTALCFVILGTIILLISFIKRKYISFLSIVITILIFIKFLGLYGVIDFQLDQILFANSITITGSQMSVFTAFNLFLLSASLIIISFKPLNRLHTVAITTITTLLLSSLALIAFILNIFSVAVLPFFLYSSSTTALLTILASLIIFFNFRLKEGVVLSLLNNSLVFGVLLGSIMLTILFAGVIEQTSYEDAQNKFKDETNNVTSNLDERLKIYINILDGAVGFLSASDNVTRTEWHKYVDALAIEENYPGIQGIGYSIFIKPENKEAHVLEIQKEGFQDYDIKPEGDRPIYTSIIYIEPFNERNQEAFGFDMFQEATRRIAMQQSRDTGEPKMTGKLTLVQEIDADVQPGFVIYVPYYGQNNSPNNVDQRRNEIIGYAYSPFRSRNFVEGVIGTGGLKDIGLKINDGVTIDESTEIYNDLNNKIGDTNKSRFSDTQTIYIAGRPWTLTYFSTKNYDYTIYAQIAPLIVLAMGISVSVLFSLIVYTVISSKQRAILYANKVTKDLKQAQAKDEAVLLSIGDGLVATDQYGKIMLVNSRFENLLGWKESEVVGKLLTDVVPMIDENNKTVAAKDRTINKALKSELKKVEKSSTVKYRTKNGYDFPVSITVSPIISQEQVIGAVEVFRDITKEKEVDAAKTEFVSLASHQLRTPLTSINWYLELLLDEKGSKLTKKQKEFFHEIQIATKQMTELVGALLNVSRIELGTFAITPEPTDLTKLAESVVEEVSPIIKDKKLKVNLTKTKLEKVSVDPKLFRIVYQNLITNAVKYTPEEGIISIDHKIENDDILITVSDTGYGIPLRQKDQIFQKLFRADNVRIKDTKGTGLGLYIVKSILESTGGRIWFESEENEGTTFFVKVPLKGMSKKVGSRVLES
ncbi:CHASE domain-containing protein [Candidatus Dojkabacteria bacterium]|uniref:histidine kinase n=1 Tax=Candidatus Dojkabacteria bacterium TaxID=2099670 RepID=A0A955L1J9_9BACT|nr:CHASE domain-containing protein [Candidatus Dojkabacteria bacterium]